VIKRGEIENSIVLSDSVVECGEGTVDSLIGTGSRFGSSESDLPKGYRLIIGENTFISV